MRLGSVINATVVEIDRDIITVDAGLKSEGLIPSSQFLDEDGQLEVGVGDLVYVSLDAVEDGFGETKLSREKAKRLMAWDDLEQAHESGEIVSGAIVERIKGGFVVDIKRVRAFLPGSLVDVRPVKDISALEGKPLDFKVVKIDRRRNNVVVSRRAVLTMDSSADREKLLESLEEGTIVEGVVKNTTDYGAFIDLGGVDGLLHITDMAWRRVKNPGEIVSIGDPIKVKILKFDRERSRVSLGLKQMGDDPWIGLNNRYPVGTRLSGKVTNLADYGCFVQLEEGVEGLVHVSEMDWTKKTGIHPAKLVQIGDDADVTILEIDVERRRISLSIKRCQPNPWREFSVTHNTGDKVVGTIRSITDFGIFVGLDGDIDGLVHLSDLSWSGNAEEALRQYNKGDELETIILAVEVERERISLGVKQVREDPFSVYIAEHPKGSKVKAVVGSIAAHGATMVLAEDGVEGYMKAAEISNEKRIEDARSELKVGDEMEVKITAIDRKKRSVNVSLRIKETDDEAATVEEYVQDSVSTPKSTLGDLFKKELDK